MASPTKKTKRIRKNKRSHKGKRRKSILRTKGSTPSKAELFKDKK